ncbi:MAG TPA: hypothetical protein VNL74_04845 [Methylococcus sp.]|nr:hypothetical protein [Methylococcus sp.]
MFKNTKTAAMAYLLGVLSITGFASGSVQAKPHVVSEADVKDCRYLSIVTGSSGYGKNMQWKSLAEHAAERKALDLGASHIVWSEFRPIGAFNGFASAKAYVCK